MNSTRTDTVRAFIAIDLPAELKKEIASIQQRFKPYFNHAKISWVRSDNMHLTLKFLGDVASTKIPKIIQACDDIRLNSAFELHLNRIGFFPGLRKPKVLWCGYESSDALSAVQTRIENTLASLGFAAEDKPFVAHLTLARIKEISSQVSTPFYVDLDAVQAIIGKTPVSLKHSVHSVQLVKSRLSPKGSEYTVLHEWVLNHRHL